MKTLYLKNRQITSLLKAYKDLAEITISTRKRSTKTKLMYMSNQHVLPINKIVVNKIIQHVLNHQFDEI